MKHIITVEDIDADLISYMFPLYEECKRTRRTLDYLYNRLHNRLRGRLMITDFFEPSTRTRLSFEAAMSYLGGRVIGTENATEFSSIKKGESIADNFRVISGYCDIIVGRFLNEGDARIAADASLVPLINGGDGKGEHPTQALVDLFSIMEKFPDAEGLRVTFLGDNKHSRTVRSLARLLARFSCITEMNFIGPSEINISLKDFDYDIWESNVKLTCYNELLPMVIGCSDIVYVTRSQIERHYSENMDEGNFIFTPELADTMPEHGLILHPLPRRSELPVEVDNNPRAYYFQQAHNGLYVRMALLEALCLKN